MFHVFFALIAWADRAGRAAEADAFYPAGACEDTEAAPCLLQTERFLDRAAAASPAFRAGWLETAEPGPDCSIPDPDLDRTICRQCEGIPHQGVEFNYAGGARPLVTLLNTGGTTCAHFCNADNDCGVGDAYEQGTDCRQCSPAPLACPAECLTCAAAHGEEFNELSMYSGVGVYLNEFFVCTDWCNGNKCGVGEYFSNPSSPGYAGSVDCTACAGNRFKTAALPPAPTPPESPEADSPASLTGCAACRACAEGPANVGGAALRVDAEGETVCLHYCVEGLCLVEDDEGVDCRECKTQGLL
jgi:hypothetical protein